MFIPTTHPHGSILPLVCNSGDSAINQIKTEGTKCYVWSLINKSGKCQTKIEATYH